MKKQEGESDIAFAIFIAVIALVVVMGGVSEAREWLWELVR